MEFIKENSKYFLLVIAIVISAYIHINATTILTFMLGTIITLLFFIGIYFLSFKFIKSNTKIKIMKGLGIVFLFALILISYMFASFYGFHSSYCYNLVGKNIITNNVQVYCNYLPWYTKIIGGDEARKILLEDCLNRKSKSYDENPTYCDVYKKLDTNRDWTKGPNP